LARIPRIAHSVASCLVAPTFVETDMTTEAPQNPDTSAQVIGPIPVGCGLNIDEVAWTVLYLASPAASGITGIVLPVDVGYLAH
jgi:NAD(P)-dependent dehydrogenase (short-subunit alcohol dehydrogenase family)